MNVILEVIIVLAVILLSMMLHELAHGFVAYKLGDDTAKEDGRLTLNPLKHLDPWLSVAMPLILLLSGGPVFGGAKPVPVNSSKLKWGPWGMALVAIAGPLTNFLIAFVAFLVGFYSGGLASGGLSGEIFINLVMVNLGFGIFNLIPIPPLDGSRVLYAIAPEGVRGVMDRIEPYGIMVVLILVVAGSGILNRLMLGGMEGILNLFYAIVGI